MKSLLNENTIEFEIPRNSIIQSYVKHRIKKLFVLEHYFYLPKSVTLKNDVLFVEYDVDLKKERAFNRNELQKRFDFLKSENIAGISEVRPVNNKFIPSINFFLPLKDSLIEDVNTFKRITNFPEKEIETLAQNHNSKNLVFDLIVFAELLNIRFQIFPYRIIKNNIIEVQKSKPNNLFSSYRQPSVQEIWDQLISNQKIRPTITFLETDKIDILTDDLYHLPKREWFWTHSDKSIIRINNTKDLPKEGYFTTIDSGSLVLSTRKLDFTKQFNSNSHFHNCLLSKYENKNTPINRDNLPKIIAENKGVFAVQGPPGTGKTYLASQVLKETLSRNKDAKILIVAKEHLALNHLLEVSAKDLKQENIDFYALRILNTSKYNIYAKNANLKDYLISNTIVDLKTEEWSEDYSNWELTFNPNPNVYDLRIRKLIVDSANIIFVSSMDGEWQKILKQKTFDLVVVEEASKAYPSELFHCVSVGINTLLIGDQQQLPPFQSKETRLIIKDIKENFDKNKDLQQSPYFKFLNKLKQQYTKDNEILDHAINWVEPFKMLYETLPENQKYLLNEEYRLEKDLSDIISKTFYKELFIHKKNTQSPYKILLPQELNKVLLWIDTEHSIENEEAGEDPEKTGERINIYELSIIRSYFGRLLNQKISKEKNNSIVVLTPYNEQKKLLLQDKKLGQLIAQTCKYPIEQIIRTVDEFQGQEAEVTIVSLVRNNVLNSENALGFISEPERLNVMFSRAKYSLVIVGCSEHIERNDSEKNKYLVSFLENYKKKGTFVKAEEFIKI